MLFVCVGREGTKPCQPQGVDDARLVLSRGKRVERPRPCWCGGADRFRLAARSRRCRSLRAGEEEMRSPSQAAHQVAVDVAADARVFAACPSGSTHRLPAVRRDSASSARGRPRCAEQRRAVRRDVERHRVADAEGDRLTTGPLDANASVSFTNGEPASEAKEMMRLSRDQPQQFSDSLPRRVSRATPLRQPSRTARAFLFTADEASSFPLGESRGSVHSPSVVVSRR